MYNTLGYVLQSLSFIFIDSTECFVLGRSSSKRKHSLQEVAILNCQQNFFYALWRAFFFLFWRFRPPRYICGGQFSLGHPSLELWSCRYFLHFNYPCRPINACIVKRCCLCSCVGISSETAKIPEEVASHTFS